MADANTDPWAALKPVGPAPADPWAALKPVGQAASREKVIATTPDGGRIVEMADGTRAFTSPGYATSDPAKVAEIMKGAKPADVSRLSGVTYGDGTGNTARQALQGMTFGFGDEIVASGASALGPNSYDTELERERARISMGTEDRPVGSLLANVGGSIASTMAGGGLVAEGAKRLLGGTQAAQTLSPLLSALTSKLPNVVNKAAAGAALGAADAGLYGFGAGEGGFSERVDNAGDNALIGAMFGGAIPVAQSALRPAMRGVMNLASAPFSSQANPANAGRAVEKAMSRAGMTQDDVAAALQRAADEGQPMFTIADATGDPGRGILNGVMRQPGPAKTEGADFLMQRQAGQGDRLTSFLTDALEAPDTAAARTASLTSARDTAADAAFGNVRGNATPVDVRGVLSTIDERITPMQGVNVDPGPIDKSLMGIRNRLASRTPASDVVPGAAAPATGAEGVQTAVELSDFDRVFALRREVADEMEAAYRAGRGQLGAELKAVRDAMDQALEGSSGEYRDAMGAYRTASDNIRAVDAGAAATSGRVRSDDVVAAIQGMTPDQLSAYRAGYADPTIARIENSAPGVNKARPLTTDKATAELGALATDPELLFSRVGRENDMFRTGGRVMNGSATVDNMGDVTDAARSTATLLGQAAINPVWALRRFAGNVADATINGVTGNNEATRAEIARAMLSSDVGNALAPLFAARQRATQADDLAALLARTGANRATENYGGN